MLEGMHFRERLRFRGGAAGRQLHGRLVRKRWLVRSASACANALCSCMEHDKCCSCQGRDDCDPETGKGQEDCNKVFATCLSRCHVLDSCHARDGHRWGPEILRLTFNIISTGCCGKARA